MPYPMTRRGVGVGGNEFNFHSFTPRRRVVDMVEGSLGLFSVSKFDAFLRRGDASSSKRVCQFCRDCDLTAFSSAAFRSSSSPRCEMPDTRNPTLFRCQQSPS